MLDGQVQRSSGDRRKELVLAAYDRIARMGLEGLRVRDVAGDVGINVATLHYHFPTKESLIQAVVAHTTGRFGSTFPAARSPADRLRGHLATVRQLLHAEPELFSVLCELTMRVTRDPAIAGMLLETDDPWHNAVRELLRQGEREGSLTVRGDPDEAAALVIAAIKGVSMPTADPRRRERIDQTFRQLERWLGADQEEMKGNAHA
jgi:AcrR family transcriptional regulator